MHSFEFDAMKNIKAIEGLKSELLMSVAKLYAAMERPGDGEKRKEQLAAILCDAYLLAQRLGTGPGELEEAAVARLRLAALEDGRQNDYVTLLTHLGNRRRQDE